MDLISVICIAVGLSMDAFAVSIASGCAARQLKMRHAFKVAASFGLFQALMPVVGWLAGIGLRRWIEAFDHWVAFGLLAFIGVKMILESRKMAGRKAESAEMDFYMLMMLSVATSIDALMVGLSFSFLNIEIWTPVLIIGAVTFGFSFAGVCIGSRLGHFFEEKIEMFGGVVLILIGLKILLGHL